MAAREDEKAIAGLLRRSLAQDTGAVAGPGSGENCPKPEILAAYFDHALDAQETARYDLHFSRCSHCREQLAAMARAGGVGDAAAAAEKTAGAWAWLAGSAWLMPASAVLVALLAITGIALRIRKPVATANEIAMSRPDALPPANSAPVTAPAPQTNSASSPETALSSGAASSAPRAMDSIAVPPSAPSGSAASRELGARLPSHTVSRANSAVRGGAFSSPGAGLGAKSSAAPAMQPQASPGMMRGAMRAGSAGNASGASGSGGEGSGSGGGVGAGAVNSADQTVTVTEAAPSLDAADAAKVIPEKKEEDSVKRDAAVSAEVAPQPNARKARSAATTSGAGAAGAAAPAQSAKAMNLAANQTMEAAALARLQQAQISSNLMNLQIQTPDPKILWMITGADAIEKSGDGGATWKLEYLETHARIIAGSAPSVKICWLVGEGGTILRTTNGAHWKTIKPPEETEFVRVEATDALTATVTTLDGRKFSTSDGGKSWNSVK
jgi:photosystem II stability/assembly factor-like uncharacterized protein